MTRNVGQIDRVLRAVIGVVLLMLAFGGTLATGWLHWLAIIVAIVLLATAAIGNCPAYSLLGKNTCRR